MAQGHLRAPPQARSLSLWPWSSGLSGSDKFPETTNPASTTPPAPLPSPATPTPVTEVEALSTLDATAATPATPDMSGAVNPATSIDPSVAAASVGELDGSHYLNLASDHIGYLGELGIDFGWGPTSMAQWSIEHLHVWGDMPWWAALVGYAVATRLVLLKPGFDAFAQQKKLQALRKDPRAKPAFDKMSGMMGSGTATPVEIMAARAEVQKLQKAAGISTWKMFLPMLQMPIGIGVFRLTGACADLPVPAFETGGFLWVTDLTMPDPYYVLPIASGLMMYNMLQNTLKGQHDKSQAAIMKLMQYVLTPVSVLISFKLNAALQIYFIASSCLQNLQTSVMRSPAFLKAAGLDHLDNPTVVANTGKIAWEAPAVIDTTATVEKAAPELDVDTGNPLTNAKNAIASVKGKISNFADKGNAKKSTKDASLYEEKRAMEEKERYYARREAAVRRARERAGQ